MAHTTSSSAHADKLPSSFATAGGGKGRTGSSSSIFSMHVTPGGITTQDQSAGVQTNSIPLSSDGVAGEAAAQERTSSGGLRLGAGQILSTSPGLQEKHKRHWFNKIIPGKGDKGGVKRGSATAAQQGAIVAAVGQVCVRLCSYVYNVCKVVGVSMSDRYVVTHAVVWGTPSAVQLVHLNNGCPHCCFSAVQHTVHEADS